MTIKQAQDQLKESIASYYIKENNRLKDKIKNMEKESSDKNIVLRNNIVKLKGEKSALMDENLYLSSKITSQSSNNKDAILKINEIVDKLKGIKHDKIVIISETDLQSRMICSKLDSSKVNSSHHISDFVCYRNLKFLCLSME